MYMYVMVRLYHVHVYVHVHVHVVSTHSHREHTNSPDAGQQTTDEERSVRRHERANDCKYDVCRQRGDKCDLPTDSVGQVAPQQRTQNHASEGDGTCVTTV